jgi:hypothetical protein
LADRAYQQDDEDEDRHDGEAGGEHHDQDGDQRRHGDIDEERTSGHSGSFR